MDTSRWLSINPKVTFSPTVKRFYRKFDHKLTYYINGASMVPRFPFTEIAYYTGIYPGDYQTTDQYHQALHQRRAYLNSLIVAYQDRKPEIKFRFERSLVSIFGTELDLLYNMAAYSLADYQSSLQSVTTVFSAQDQAVLDRDCIVVRESPSHAYRVYIRDGFYRNVNERQALAAYLTNLGDQVRITENLLAEITSTSKYIRAGYFYVNDPRLVDMISLINPRFVQRVQQLVVA